ncbi:hypothetical protein OO012_06500 [Rhodobacteraceae bacterium KMM 6894]|nr:hypothetical protein [Rhodobacteraceae bacterium KMM 6894]
MKSRNGTGTTDCVALIPEQGNFLFDAFEYRQICRVVQHQHRHFAVRRLQGFQIGVSHVLDYSKPDAGLRKLGKENSAENDPAGSWSWSVERSSISVVAQ